MKKSKSYLYYVYEKSSTGGEICAGDENSEWPSYEDEYVDVDLPSIIYLKNEKDEAKLPWTRERFEVPEGIKVGDILYLVVVRYTTGGTFGCTQGEVGFEGLYVHKGQASKIVQSIKDDKYFVKNKYAFWKGYFESLESVSIQEVRVV